MRTMKQQNLLPQPDYNYFLSFNPNLFRISLQIQKESSFMN